MQESWKKTAGLGSIKKQSISAEATEGIKEFLISF